MAAKRFTHSQGRRTRRSDSDVAVFGEGLRERHALCDLVANEHFLAGELLGCLEHAQHVRCRHDDAAVLVAQHEVAGMDHHAFAGGAAQVGGLAAAGDPPTADRLHRRAIACIDREAVRTDPAHVANAAVDQRADTAVLLHPERDQLAEIADAFAVAAPDADLVRADALAGLHLGGIAGAFVGHHLSADGVGEAGKLARGCRKRPERRGQALVRQAHLVEHVGDVRRVDGEKALADHGAHRARRRHDPTRSGAVSLRKAATALSAVIRPVFGFSLGMLRIVMSKLAESASTEI